MKSPKIKKKNLLYKDEYKEAPIAVIKAASDIRKGHGLGETK